MRLFLVRHGQTAWNAAQRAQGHCDTELDETGLAQAEGVAQALESEGVQRIVSSDLRRCVQTASPISQATGRQIELQAALRERHFGHLEGLPYEEVRARIAEKAAQIGAETHATRPDQGESYLDVWDRLSTVRSELSTESKTTVLVSHGGTLGLLLAGLLGQGFEEARAFRFANASITELVRAEGTWSIKRQNDSRHLEVAREGFGTGA